MSHFKRLWSWVILAGVGAIALIALNTLPFTRSTPPPLRIAYNLWPGYFPMVLAQERGYFAQQGVQVELDRVGGTIMTDFRAGKYDGLALTLGNAITTNETEPIRIVMAMDDSMGADAIVAQSQMRAIADLRGQSIGATLGGFGELFLERMLAAGGLPRDAVTFVESDPSEVPEELRDNKLQAAHTWEPHISRAVADGKRVLFTSADTPGLITDVIFFKEEIARDRPDEIRAFVQACFQAIEDWQANFTEGNALIAQALGLDPQEISLEGIRLLTQADNRERFNPNHPSSLYRNAQLYTDFFLRVRAIEAPPNLDRLIDPSFIQP
ncbi:MAG: ABC transporter substrate-binding protein [Desertifilum sp.]|nr:ABC transporter substrate-binding protein [Desertifilum sp.]